MSMEPPDVLEERDLLVADRNTDVVAHTLRAMLARGMSAQAILGEIPTVSERAIRDAQTPRASSTALMISRASTQARGRAASSTP